jgi:hypothetical protein
MLQNWIVSSVGQSSVVTVFRTGNECRLFPTNITLKLRLQPGVNVMIINFGDFDQFFQQKSNFHESKSLLSIFGIK